MDQVVKILTDKLVEVLESEKTHLEMSLAAMNEMRASVIKKDEMKLKKLLSIVGTETQAYANVQKQRDIICEQLANVLNIDLSDFCLTELIVSLDGDAKDVIRERQAELLSLAGQVKEEYQQTSMFLKECVRFNNTLLRSVFGNTNEITYNSQGHEKWRSHAMQSQMVNMVF